MEKDTGKVREFCQSEKVGTLFIIGNEFLLHEVEHFTKFVSLEQQSTNNFLSLTFSGQIV